MLAVQFIETSDMFQSCVCVYNDLYHKMELKVKQNQYP